MCHNQPVIKHKYSSHPHSYTHNTYTQDRWTQRQWIVDASMFLWYWRLCQLGTCHMPVPNWKKCSPFMVPNCEIDSKVYVSKYVNSKGDFGKLFGSEYSSDYTSDGPVLKVSELIIIWYCIQSNPYNQRLEDFGLSPKADAVQFFEPVPPSNAAPANPNRIPIKVRVKWFHNTDIVMVMILGCCVWSLESFWLHRPRTRQDDNQGLSLSLSLSLSSFLRLPPSH